MQLFETRGLHTVFNSWHTLFEAYDFGKPEGRHGVTRSSTLNEGTVGRGRDKDQILSDMMDCQPGMIRRLA